MPFPSEQQSKCKKQKQVNNKYKCKIQIEKKKSLQSGISLVVQWLRILPSNAGDMSTNSGQGTKIHMLRGN